MVLVNGAVKHNCCKVVGGGRDKVRGNGRTELAEPASRVSDFCTMSVVVIPTVYADQTLTAFSR